MFCKLIPWGKDLFGVLIKMKKRYKILLGLLSVVVLYKGYHYWLYTPRINKHPKHFVTISGTVDRRALPADFKLRFIAVNDTANDACEVTYNWFEGAVGDREKKVFYTPVINENKHYSVKIPTQIFQRGYCDWRLYQVQIQYFNHLADTLYALGETTKNRNNSFYADFVCKKNRCVAATHKKYFEKLSRKQDFFFTFNYR